MSAAVLGFTAATEVRPEPRRVEAKASKSENSDKRVRKMYDRFQTFATIQINEQCFMTPADFLEAVTEANPRKSAFKTSYSREEMLKHLKATTPTTANADIAGDTNFFRRLGRNGLISYNEYLFLLSIITKPKQVRAIVKQEANRTYRVSRSPSKCSIQTEIKKLTLKNSKFSKISSANRLLMQ